MFRLDPVERRGDLTHRVHLGRAVPAQGLGFLSNGKNQVWAKLISQATALIVCVQGEKSTKAPLITLSCGTLFSLISATEGAEFLGMDQLTFTIW